MEFVARKFPEVAQALEQMEKKRNEKALAQASWLIYIYIYADIFFSVLVLVGSPRTFASSLPPEEMVRYMVISFKVSGPRRDQGEQARHAASIETERASVVLDV